MLRKEHSKTFGCWVWVICSGRRFCRSQGFWIDFDLQRLMCQLMSVYLFSEERLMFRTQTVSCTHSKWVSTRRLNSTFNYWEKHAWKKDFICVKIIFLGQIFNNKEPTFARRKRNNPVRDFISRQASLQRLDIDEIEHAPAEKEEPKRRGSAVKTFLRPPTKI